MTDDQTTQLGTPLRDAAVDPREADFLAPTNAGEPGPLGNPHGPTVISIEVGSPEYDRIVPEVREQRGDPLNGPTAHG